MNRGSGKLIFALDGIRERKEVENWVKRLFPLVYRFKVGKELFTREGPEVVKIIRGSGGEVFLDLKFHDIPETVARAVEAASGLGVEILNVHASGGKAMMKAAREAASAGGEGSAWKAPRIVAVTVLTSLNQNDLREMGLEIEMEKLVLNLARLAREAGLDGVVASPWEARAIRRELGEDFLIITPGIRSGPGKNDDQKRVSTPESALAAGASLIVVGRDIRNAEDPVGQAQAIEARIAQVGKNG
ncbi:MAG: orotidine-5'-phosphate decarboxylase [Proteobacteria bacterium]|nr:orotidine-5'-phosphate decarboxylase [Pseudomonadota bacterium]